MSLYFLNNEGRWEDARHRGRQPREEHWGHYRKAMKNRPDLVEAMDKKTRMANLTGEAQESTNFYGKCSRLLAVCATK